MKSSKTEIVPGYIQKNDHGEYTFSNFVIYSNSAEAREIHEIIMDDIKGDILWIRE